MSWWSRLFPTGEGAVPNANPPGVPPTVGGNDYTPGDPHGVVMDPATGVFKRMSAIVPSPWDGWPSGWGLAWQGSSGKLEDLVDTAWSALDLNASIVSCMPVYRIRGGEILPPTSWMTNPDPSIYSSWCEFMKQLIWEFQLGEAFVLPMARDATGFPFQFRVIPQWLIGVEMDAGTRRYTLGGPGGTDITGDVLHIRYKSSTDQPRGQGPLETARTRLIAAGLLAKYATEVAEGGFIPKFTLNTEQRMNRAQSDELLEQWWASRQQNAGQPWKPAVLSGGVEAKPLQLTPEQLSLVDLSKWNESRIAVLCGVPPTLLGLPTEDSSTYKNVNALFDFHDRASLHPKIAMVMQALSGWLVPRGQQVELNRDEYTRPPLLDRATAYEKLVGIGVLSLEEIRTMERFTGPEAATALTGGGVG